MLDSLVRVSRRVGQVTDRFATDPEPATTDRRLAIVRGQRALTTVPAVRDGRTGRRSRRRPRTSSSVRRCDDGPTPPGAVTPTREGVGHLLRRLLTADEPVVALRPPKMHTPPRGQRTRRTPRGCRRRARREAGELNPTDGLCGPLRLPLNGFTYC